MFTYFNMCSVLQEKFEDPKEVKTVHRRTDMSMAIKKVTQNRASKDIHFNGHRKR
jgi:hypothetical protein